MADRLKELDLKDIEPFCFAEAHENPLREDNSEPFARIPEILADRADASAGMGAFFKVPCIMEE